MKKHSDHSNSYKGKHLIGADVEFRGLFLYQHDEKAWQHTYRVGDEEDLSFLNLDLQAAGSELRQAFSDRTTSTPAIPQLLIMLFLMGQAFKCMSLCRSYLFKSLQIITKYG